jgi:gamma-glutamyltranspeptidase/glutathione hydrolase
MKGVVAAGHPLSAQAGADVLKAGGNAVDAAVACVLMSFVTESALTGPGAGGFMLVHTAEGADHLLDFFVAAPGKGLDKLEPAALQPIDVEFAAEAIQRFNIGPSSCGVYGTPLGLAEALGRFGRASLADLVGAPARAAREGVELTAIQAYLTRILGPIVTAYPEGRKIYMPEGRYLREG